MARQIIQRPSCASANHEFDSSEFFPMTAPSIQSMSDRFLTMKTMAAFSRTHLHEKSIVSNGDRNEFRRAQQRPEDSNFTRRVAGHQLRDQPVLRRLPGIGEGRGLASQASRARFAVGEAGF